MHNAYLPIYIHTRTHTPNIYIYIIHLTAVSQNKSVNVMYVTYSYDIYSNPFSLLPLCVCVSLCPLPCFSLLLLICELWSSFFFSFSLFPLVSLPSAEANDRIRFRLLLKPVSRFFPFLFLILYDFRLSVMDFSFLCWHQGYVLFIGFMLLILYCSSLWFSLFMLKYALLYCIFIHSLLARSSSVMFGPIFRWFHYAGVTRREMMSS